jgi:hypothetical protein
VKSQIERYRLTDTPRTDGLLRRIDYIRATAQMSRTGITAPPGNNPYEGDFSIMPLDEIRRILSKYHQSKKGRQKQMTITNIARAAGLTSGDEISGTGRQQLLHIIRGEPHRLGRKTLRALTRVLLQIENGTLVKIDGKLVHQVAPTKKPEMVFRVCLGPDGRATITRAPAPPAPKQMPKLFADFRLPGEK